MKTWIPYTLMIALLTGIVLLVQHPALLLAVCAWLPEDAPTGIVLLLVVLLISRPTGEPQATGKPHAARFRSL